MELAVELAYAPKTPLTVSTAVLAVSLTCSTTGVTLGATSLTMAGTEAVASPLAFAVAPTFP